MSAFNQSAQRFTSRAEDYAKWRPGYPPEVVQFWANTLGWNRGDTIVDLGAGTGIMSELLLEAGYRVIGVEPNAEMRAAAIDEMGDRDGFKMLDTSAEATGLPDASAQGAVAAQAYHWFDGATLRRELQRVLVPPHGVGLVWNVRQIDTSPFAIAFHEFLQKWGTDYEAVYERHSHPEASMADLYGDAKPERAVFTYGQRFGFVGLRGRLLSCSFVPTESDPTFESMIEALRVLYDEHAANGEVCMAYDTRAYAGPLRR